MASLSNFYSWMAITLAALTLINLPGHSADVAYAGDHGCPIASDYSKSHPKSDRLPGQCCANVQCSAVIPALPVVGLSVSKALVISPRLDVAVPLLLIRLIDPPPKRLLA